MPRNENFEKFAKNMQSLGMPASAGILYNNMHNRSVFDKVYDIAVANGLDLDKETLIQKIGIGEIKDDYQILDSKGIKVKPTAPKPTLAPKVVAPIMPKPTTTLKDFTIPSVQQGIATKKELNLSPSPTKSEVVVEDRPIPKVPQLSDIKPIENFSLPTNLPTQTDYRGANFKQPTFDIEPAYSKLSIDDVIADNKTFSNKYSATYEEESDAKYKLDQSNSSTTDSWYLSDDRNKLIGQENKYKYEKSNIDNQYKAIDVKAKQLSYIIGDKFKTKDILVDIEQGNNQINAQLKQFEALKATKDPILKDLQSKMQSLNQAYQAKQIDENAYKAEFASLSAKYEVEANEVNKKGKEINELQANFQSKFNDPDVNNYLKLLKKKYEVSVEGISLIDDPRFTLIKEKEDKYSVKQQRADEKEKLRMSLNSGEITQAEYFKQLKEKGFTDLSTTNTNAFIADKLSDLLKQGLTLPRMAGGIFNNEYGWTDKLADVATSIAESKQKSNPYSSDMAVKSYQKFAQVGDFRVLLDEKGNPYDVRDSKYFSIQPLQAEAILEQYNQSPDNYTKYNQANASVFTKDALSTIADVGIMIAGTKGLGSLVKGGTLANTIIGSGISFAQIQPDIYEQAINSGLNPQHASQLSALVSGGISIIGLINPVESKLAGGGGLFGGASKIALSNADVALINSGKLSVSQIANKYIKGIAKNILGENFEEVIAEPLWQDMISNIYKSQLTENSEGFDKQFDPISHQGLETALLTSVVAIPFGIAEVNQEMPHLQSIALQTAIDNPDVYNQILEQRKEKGLITEVEMGAQMLQMEEISSIYNSVKDEIKKERQPELIALLAKKNVAQNKIAEIKDDVLSTNWKSTLEKINNDIQNILNDKPTVNNLVEVEDLIEEETPITQENETPIAQEEETPKVFSDFDNTLYDPQTGELTELGEQMKERIANGEDIEIVTAREDTPENRKLIADKLGIDDSKISMGLTPEMKAEKVAENEGESQFIDDNTENLNAVTELENENIEVVPVVSKGQSAIDKLKARFKPKPIEEEVVTPIAEEAPTVEVAPIVSNETKIAELRQERDDIKLSVDDSVEEATAKINRASEILNEIKALEKKQQENKIEQPTPTALRDVEPIRQLGTGANVYFETDKYRVNDNLKNGKVLLNIGDANSETPLANIEFDTPNEAVFVAKKIAENAPVGLDAGFHNVNKIIENYKKEYSESLLSKEQTSVIEEINSKNLTRVEGLGMGMNQAVGTYISTESGNRYETDGNAQKVTVTIKNPLVVTEDIGLIELRNQNVNKFVDEFEDIDFDGYENPNKEKLSIEDLSETGLAKLAEITTRELKKQGYDSIYFRESDIQEGELVIFDKQNVTIDGKEQQSTSNEIEQDKAIKAIGDKAKDAEDNNDAAVAKEVIDKIDAEIKKTAEQQARDNGKKIVDGTVVKRQGKIKALLGNAVNLLFSKQDSQEARYAIIELSDLQPSHKSGVKNENHFIPEAQPRDRGGLAVLKNEAKQKADNLDPNQLGENNIAYFGSPIINERGEVIQGNGRAEAIDYYYRNNKKDSRGYKAMIKEKAVSLGINVDEVAKMKNPVLVRLAYVTDEQAIILGNKTASELEDVKQKGADVKAAMGKLNPQKIAEFTKVINSKIDETSTLKSIIRDNAKIILDKLIDLGAVRADEKEQFFNGIEVTPEGIQKAYDITRQLLFDGGDADLQNKFDNLPAKIRNAIEKTIPAILSNTELKSKVQDVINHIYNFYESGNKGFDNWTNQRDIFGDQKTPLEKYDNETLKFAKQILEEKTEKDIAKRIVQVAQNMNGKEGNMFDEATPKKPFNEAIQFSADNSVGKETTTPQDKKEVSKIIEFFNKMFGFDGFAPFSEFYPKLKSLGYDSLQAMVEAFGSENDYRMSHKAPNKDDSPLYDLSNVYGDDIYSDKAWYYFGDGADNKRMDKASAKVLQAIKGNPNAEVTIYRAVPKGVKAINNGDWVSISKEYAIGHGENVLDGEYEIIEQKVKASQVYSDGNSLHEQGVQFLKTPSGKVLGFVSDGKIYLNPNALTAKTAFHELAHVQQALIKIASQKGDAIAKAVMQRWDRLMKDNDVIGQVRKFSKSKGTPTQFSITMPDGSTKQVQTVNADVVNGFYSPLEKIISETKFDKLPAKQWIEKFAKGEEAKWTGLTEWLNSQTGSVSKADIQAYLKDNRISVVEVVKGSYSKQVDELYKKLEAKNKGREFDDWDVKDQDEWMAKRGEPQETKFSQYQLEGEKENYKEVLVTLPQSRQQKEINRLAEKYGVENTYTALRQSKATDSELEVVRGLKNDQFKSSHFDEPNILVHLRMNTRTDAEGNKVLFLEEVQSDWGQEGKKKGFDEKYKENEVTVLDQNSPEATEPNLFWYFKVPNNVLQIPKSRYKTIEEAKAYVVNDKKKIDSGIPQAPFVTDTNSWTKLGLKVALKEAVKQGADKIAWTTGEQQNDRYDLSKQVDYIQHEDGFGETKYVDISTPNGLITFQVDKRGKILENKNQQVPESIGKNLADVIGKDITERILNSTKSGRIEGDGLKVGGKGMKGFYGSPTEGSLGIVGNVAKSLFKQEPKIVTFSDGSEYMYELLMDDKKWDEYGNQESLNEAKKDLIDSGIDSKRLSENKRFLSGRNEDLYKSTQHSIDITPELKAQVEQGQALFQAEGDGKRVIKIADTNKTHEIDLSATVYDQAENESDADYEERIMNEVWSYLTDAKNAKLWTEATKGGKIRNFINAVANFFKRKLGLKGMTVDEIMNSDLKTLIERTANSLMKGEWFELQKEKQAKTQPYFNYDPTNEEHVEDNDIINEYIDAVVEDGRIPTIEEFKAELGDEVFDNIIDKLGLPFIEGKFNDTTIKDLVLENLSKKQKASPLVKRGQATLGEESRTLFDEIGRTYTSDKWKEIEPQVDAFVQRILGSKDFSGSVRELMQWMKDMPMGAYLNEDGLATAHTMILNKLVMHSYALDKELFKEVFKFAKIRGTSFGQAISAYAEASTPESLFNNAIGDLEMEKENILDTIQPSGLTLKEELDNILEQITIKADEITSVLDAIDEKTQKTVTKTKGKRKSTGTTTTPSAVAPRSTEQKKKAKERIDKAKSRLGDWWQKQGIVKFAYNPQDDLNEHIELLSISKELVLGYLDYGYASALKLKEKLQEAIGKNINVDDIWISVYDEEVRSKVKEVQVEVLEKAILFALSDGNGKQQDMITQLAGLLRAEANKLMPKKENKTNVEEKVRLLFENKELSKLAWENALKKKLDELEETELSDEQKAERKKALEDAIGKFSTITSAISKKAIQEALKDANLTMLDIIKMNDTDAKNAIIDLIKKLVIKAGLSQVDANDYARILLDEATKQISDKEKSIVTNIQSAEIRKITKPDSNPLSSETKVRLLFENKELAEIAFNNALKKGLAQIESSNLTDEQKAERKKALEDAIGNFVTVPNSVSRKAIQVGLKDLKETIEDIAKMHFTEASNVVETLVDKLVMEAGLSYADAVEYAKILTDEINKQLKDKKVKLLDKLLNTKSRKVVKLTELEKIINAVNLGALSSSDFSNLFAKKFGFKAITPEQIQYLHDTINLMFETNGIMRRRMAQKLADYIDSMKPLWDARAFWRLIQNVVHQHALNGANTYGNIIIGSTASVVSNLLGSLALNFNAFKRANKAYNKAKLKGTGTYAAIDTMWTGYNDMHNFTTEENFVEKGSRYHKWVNKWGYKSVSDFLLLLYKPIAQLGYFASAFDNIVNHRGGEILNYIAEYNAIDKKGMSIQDIYDLVEKKMGYADADMFSQQVDEEIQDYKANGIKIPIGFKEQRLKELMISHRDKERQLKAYETVRTFGLMGKPDGLSGSLYDFLKPASIIQDTDSNLTAHMKGIYSTTIALFLRISFASAGAVINSTPILGFFAGAYRIEKNEETKKREFRRATGREYAHTAVMQTASIASLVFGFMAMFDLEDDENGKTIISLDPDRLIDISGTNIEFFDQEKLRLDNGQYKSLSIRFRTSKDSKWGPFREVGKYLPFAVPNMAILGNLRDRILIKQEDNKEDDLKQIYPNPKEVLNSLLSIGGGLQVASYNSLAQFISKASAIASYKNNSPEIQAEKKMQDAAKLAYNTITRPAKTILQTNLHRDITKSIAALANSQKKSDNIYMNVFKDFYGFDPFINHKELDIFGNKAMKIVPVLDKDERYNMPEWKLLREKNIVFDPPYFYKTGTFDGEKVKITNDERLMLNDRVSVEFGNLIRENLNELKTMTQLELLQEFRMYATLAKAEVTLMKYEDAIKPIDYEKAVKRFD